MKTTIAATILASLAIAGCADAPKTAQVSATPESDGGYMHVYNGKRQEYLVGSRLARDSRENAESVKAMGVRGYKEAQDYKSGSPMDGQRSGGM
jgi:hypothetical protein